MAIGNCPNSPPGSKVDQLDHLAKGGQVLRVGAADAVRLAHDLEQGVAGGIFVQKKVDLPHGAECARRRVVGRRLVVGLTATRLSAAGFEASQTFCYSKNFIAKLPTKNWLLPAHN